MILRITHRMIFKLEVRTQSAIGGLLAGDAPNHDIIRRPNNTIYISFRFSRRLGGLMDIPDITPGYPPHRTCAAEQ